MYGWMLSCNLRCSGFLNKMASLPEAQEEERPLFIEMIRSLILRKSSIDLHKKTTQTELQGMLPGFQYCMDYNSVSKYKQKLLLKLIAIKESTNCSLVEVKESNLGGVGVFARVNIGPNVIIPLYGHNARRLGVTSMFPSIESNTVTNKIGKLAPQSHIHKLLPSMDGPCGFYNHSCGSSSNASYMKIKSGTSMVVENRELRDNYVNCYELNKKAYSLFAAKTKQSINRGEEITVNYNDKPPGCCCVECIGGARKRRRLFNYCSASTVRIQI